MLFYEKGNFRNWDRLEVKKPVECLWCGHRWATNVRNNPVCPKCRMTEYLAKKVLADPSGDWGLSHKTRTMRGKFK